MIVDERGTDEILASAFKSKQRCRALCLVFCRASFARVLARSLARSHSFLFEDCRAAHGPGRKLGSCSMVVYIDGL